MCFDKRFLTSAQKALELGEKKITTTLLVSPLKSQEQLKRVGDAFYEKHGVEFVAVDYRSGGGTQDQSRVTKEEQLYRQDYCGCIYGLTMQREQQNKLMDEMFSPISNQILPASIEERLALYTQRMALEDEGKNYTIIKEKFLNYRQFQVLVESKKQGIIPAHALAYSTLPRKKAVVRLDTHINNVHYANREELKAISLASFNTLTNTKYANVKELIFNPPTIQKELYIRTQVTQNPYDLSPILIFDTIPTEKLNVKIDATTYEDTKEKLIVI